MKPVTGNSTLLCSLICSKDYSIEYNIDSRRKHPCGTPNWGLVWKVKEPFLEREKNSLEKSLVMERRVGMISVFQSILLKRKLIYSDLTNSIRMGSFSLTGGLFCDILRREKRREKTPLPPTLEEKGERPLRGLYLLISRRPMIEVKNQQRYTQG